MIAMKEVSGSGIQHKENTVAVVELTGMIESSKEILEQLHIQANDDSVKGIVLKVDSPGGAVGPSQEIFEAVRRLKAQKPIVASMSAVAASGGLYAALGASKVLAQPGTITGSIGVIMQLPNLRKVTEKLGVDMVTIKSGELKDVGNTFREMTEGERAFLQSTLNDVHLQFTNAVAQARGLTQEQVQQFADGRIIMGSQAKELGLIDGYGDMYVAAREVFELLGEPLAEDQHPNLVFHTDKFSELRRIFQSARSTIGLLTENSVRLRYVMP